MEDNNKKKNELICNVWF